MCGRLPHSCEKGGADTGPSPVDRRKTGSKHHLICDGRGTPLTVITTAANVNDVTQTLALVDGIPPVAGRPGRPRRRPDSLEVPIMIVSRAFSYNSHRSPRGPAARVCVKSRTRRSIPRGSVVRASSVDTARPRSGAGRCCGCQSCRWW
ncbi:transposase [Streptomyces sp. NPDC002928]|uniref:transposase n=1 Tax=Streptomyces sp. NPDC002928 TaxID=3154440 RepID=UPI0033B36799